MRYELDIEIQPGSMLMVEGHVDHRGFNGCPHSDQLGDAREQDLPYLGAIYVYGG